jgi:hypothetical protein
MGGAHDRNVLRWDARRALLDREVERLERELARVREDVPRAEALARQLEEARQRRRALGPDMRPKMG